MPRSIKEREGRVNRILEILRRVRNDSVRKAVTFLQNWQMKEGSNEVICKELACDKVRVIHERAADESNANGEAFRMIEDEIAGCYQKVWCKPTCRSWEQNDILANNPLPLVSAHTKLDRSTQPPDSNFSAPFAHKYTPTRNPKSQPSNN